MCIWRKTSSDTKFKKVFPLQCYLPLNIFRNVYVSNRDVENEIIQRLGDNEDCCVFNKSRHNILLTGYKRLDILFMYYIPTSPQQCLSNLITFLFSPSEALAIEPSSKCVC